MVRSLPRSQVSRFYPFNFFGTCFVHSLYAFSWVRTNTQEVPNAYLAGLPRYWVSTQEVRTKSEIRMGTDPIRRFAMGESSPNNKVRKKCVFLKLIFVPTYHYVCKKYTYFFPDITKTNTLQLTLHAYCAEYGAALPPWQWPLYLAHILIIVKSGCI